VTIPDLDETTIRAISLVCAMMLKPNDEQAAMAIAAAFQEYIDPIADDSDFTFTLEKQP